MYSLGCILKKVGWVMHFWRFKDMHFAWLGVLAMLAKDLIEHNNPANACFISLNNILYYS